MNRAAVSTFQIIKEAQRSNKIIHLKEAIRGLNTSVCRTTREEFRTTAMEFEIVLLDYGEIPFNLTL